MSAARRIREQRSLYTRVPDPGAFRTNSPDGFLHDFLPIAQPSDALEVSGIGDWWRGDGDEPWSRTTGSPLTERSNAARRAARVASVLPAITRCTGIITEAVVRTRWVYMGPDNKGFPEPLWVSDPMLQGRAPGPIFPLLPAGRRVDGHSFWAGILAYAILWGRGAFTFIESADGSPIPGSLIPLNPFMIDVEPDGTVVLDRWSAKPVRTDFDGRFSIQGQTWRVAVLPGLYPNRGGWPEGVLLRHFNTFRVGAQISNYLGDLFLTGVPSGYLSVATPNFGSAPVPDPDAPGELVAENVLLKREWMRAHGRGRRSIAVLNSMVTYTPVAINPVDAEAVKLSESSRIDIAHAFGLSSIWLDQGVGGLNYSNSSERRADLVNLTAAGWGDKLLRLISSLMPYGSSGSVNWITFIAPSTETLIPAMVQAVSSGILSAHEARQILGIVPWEGADPAWEDRSPAVKEPEPVPAALQTAQQAQPAEEAQP
jgi:hypothetical protein